MCLKNFGLWLRAGPTDVDVLIRELHPSMALYPSGQSQQIRRHCQYYCLYPPTVLLPWHSYYMGIQIKKKEIFVFVKLMGEAQGEIKHYYQDTTKRPPHVKPNCSLSVM